MSIELSCGNRLLARVLPAVTTLCLFSWFGAEKGSKGPNLTWEQRSRCSSAQYLLDKVVAPWPSLIQAS